MKYPQYKAIEGRAKVTIQAFFEIPKSTTKKQKESYLKLVEENSIYDYNVKRGLDDDYITLITCTRIFGNTNQSIYISAKRVNKINNFNYSVKKNSNYKKIENRLEGEKNE